MRKILFSGILALASLITFAQNSISGQVTDDTGEGMPGVTVIIQGTTDGTVTDLNGNFNLSVPEGQYKLVISSLGFETMTFE